jgi:hypothetical protein
MLDSMARRHVMTPNRSTFLAAGVAAVDVRRSMPADAPRNQIRHVTLRAKPNSAQREAVNSFLVERLGRPRPVLSRRCDTLIVALWSSRVHLQKRASRATAAHPKYS